MLRGTYRTPVLAGDVSNGATQENGVARHVQITVEVDVATLQHFALHEANVIGI